MLYAPARYWLLDPEAHREICNGCGPKGFGLFVPDTIWGLPITEACDIHDFMYAMGETEEDRREADRVFLNNLLRLVEGGCRWLRPLRRRRALTYARAVMALGGPAFWSGKNPPETEAPVARRPRGVA
jgi:hypothetical protein